MGELLVAPNLPESVRLISALRARDVFAIHFYLPSGLGGLGQTRLGVERELLVAPILPESVRLVICPQG